MNYLVMVLAIISIILVLVCKYYSLSIVYPTLVIILTILLDIASNMLKARKDKKEGKEGFKIDKKIKVVL